MQTWKCGDILLQSYNDLLTGENEVSICVHCSPGQSMGGSHNGGGVAAGDIFHVPVGLYAPGTFVQAPHLLSCLQHCPTGP